MRILCTGDIHVGRRPTRLPEQADVTRLTAAQAWRDIVALATASSVDLVVLTGDVVDRENRYFEAFGPLEEGVRRLQVADIPVVAVAGNHDFDVLPRLAAALPDGFRLLGTGGRWERYTIEKDSFTLHLDGWSFPAVHHRSDPLGQYRMPVPRDGVLLGLVHGDLENQASDYAPLDVHALRDTPVAFWLLGHIHAPRLIQEAGRPGMLYPGSPLALSPKETGRHGPWILTLGPGGWVEASQVALSRVRYEPVEVDLEGVDSEEQIDGRVVEAVRCRLDQVLEEDGDRLRHLLCRLRLTGRTVLHRRVQARLEGVVRELELTGGRHAIATVESFTAETRPACDLDRLAREVGPPAALARFLLALRQPEAENRARWLREARQILEEMTAAAPYRELRSDQLLEGVGATEHELVNLLERQGLLLLDELLAQHSGGGAS